MKAFRRVVALSGCLLPVLNASASQASTGEQPDMFTAGLTQVQLAGQTISLSNQQGHCTLAHANNVPVTLDMKWPCRFSEDQQKKVRVEDYRKALVVMVERSEPLPAPSKNCKTDRQPVRLYKGKLEVAPVGQIAACGPAHWDQKAFIAFFDWSER